MKTRVPTVVLLVMCLVFLCFGVLCINDTIYYTPDSPHYLGWAKSLASFEGFKIPFGPEPMFYVINAPLYPVLIAPVAWFAPYSVPAAKAATLLFGVLALVLFYHFAARAVGPTAALVGTAFLMISPLVLLYSTQVLSDVPFSAAVIIFLMLAERSVNDPAAPRWVLPSFVVAVCAALLLREVGFVLLFSATAFFVVRRHYTRLLPVLTAGLLVYLLWYIRNEVIVAGIENPPLRNTHLFFMHFLTPESSGMFQEFTARVESNLAFYVPLLGAMLFIPQYVGRMYDVVQDTDPLLNAVRVAVEPLQVPLMVLTFLVVAYGLYRVVKTSRTGLLHMFFIAFYVVVIILYPVNDTRFLLPLLLVSMYYCMVAAKDLFDRVRASARMPAIVATLVAALLGVLLAIPNGAWTWNFVQSSIAYGQSSQIPSSLAAEPTQTPGEFSKGFRQAAEWITAHSDSSAVILSNYKEVGLWAGARKIVSMVPVTPLEEFEATVRDYNVSYVVSHRIGRELSEFEPLMAFSGKYTFIPAYQTGDVDVLTVARRIPARHATGISSPASTPRNDTSTTGGEPPASLRSIFIRGLHSLFQREYGEAEAAFQILRSSRRSDVLGLYHAALTAELSLNLDAAAARFREFRLIPQAGVWLRPAQGHLDIISRLKAAATERVPSERAYLYHSVSLNYWQLGFTRQSMDMLHRSLQADPSYFPAIVFGAVFALQEGNFVEADSFVRIADRVKPEHELTRSLHSLLALEDTLRTVGGGSLAADMNLSLAQQYAGIGLYELSIDRALTALELDPTGIRALSMLSDLYLAKRRFAPALNILKRLQAVQPDNTDARAKIAEILKRW